MVQEMLYLFSLLTNINIYTILLYSIFYFRKIKLCRYMSTSVQVAALSLISWSAFLTQTLTAQNALTAIRITPINASHGSARSAPLHPHLTAVGQAAAALAAFVEADKMFEPCVQIKIR